MKIFAIIFIVIGGLLEAIALLEYFQFPNIQAIHQGILFSCFGMVFILISIYLYRIRKRDK